MSETTYVRIPLDAIILLKGMSKDGKPYEFLQLGNDFRNNKGNIDALVKAGITVSDKTPTAAVETSVHAEQGALTLTA